MLVLSVFNSVDLQDFLLSTDNLKKNWISIYAEPSSSVEP